MPAQTQLFPEPEQNPQPHLGHSRQPATADRGIGVSSASEKNAPVWLQRLSLFVLVLFCVYLGVLVMVLPWTRMWDQNLFIESRPQLARVLHVGAVRGIISGLGLLDIWIGISEAVHYREARR